MLSVSKETLAGGIAGGLALISKGMAVGGTISTWVGSTRVGVRVMVCGCGKRDLTGCGPGNPSTPICTPMILGRGIIFYGELNQKRMLFDYGSQRMEIPQ